VDDWSEVFGAQVENGRWLLDRESARIDGLHQRASYLLGFTGVILAILPTTLDPIQGTHDLHLRWLAWALVSLAAVSLATGALFSLLTIAIRKTLNLGVKGMQETWVEWSNNLQTPDTAQVLANIANALMGRQSTAVDSPVLAIRADGDVRANRLRISVWSSTCGIIVLAILFIVLVASRIWP
jgi:hypothetical protein